MSLGKIHPKRKRQHRCQIGAWPNDLDDLWDEARCSADGKMGSRRESGPSLLPLLAALRPAVVPGGIRQIRSSNASMASQPQQIVAKLWNYCNILRADTLSYGDRVE